MWSKNKPSPTKAERAHIDRIKEMACVVCERQGPSDCHEIEQGLWFASIPLCRDCHTGQVMGLHGQKRAWTIRKMTELRALAVTVERLAHRGAL